MKTNFLTYHAQFTFFSRLSIRNDAISFQQNLLLYFICSNGRPCVNTANNQAVNTEHCILFHKTYSATGFDVLILH